ncbi:glycosyltransferase family 4 protein [Candidatus Uhrbacteria bacterium]|nr:glycosyltransferase family 4 protein [Candidatus Uhrbacteria bacterium]
MKYLLATGIYPPDIGGPASFTYDFAKELVKLGHKVTVVCYGNSEDRKEEGWDVEYITKKTPVLFRYWKYFLKIFFLAPGFEIVFFQGPVSEGFPGSVACVLRKKKYALKIVGDVAWEQYSQDSTQSPELLDEFVKHRHFGKYQIMELMERWTAKRAAHVFVPSQYLKKIVIQWGIDASRIKVILNTITPFELDKTREQIRKKFNLTEKIVLFSPGRMVPWKNFDFIFRLLPKLPDMYVYVLGGEGTCLEKWKNTVKDIGIADRVSFVGRLKRQEIGEWMLAADVHLLPSSYEGFPHVVAEAASLGLPSIVSDRGGNPETREIFPGLVQVAPFLDEHFWISALQSIPERKSSLQPRKFTELVHEYITNINSV